MAWKPTYPQERSVGFFCGPWLGESRMGMANSLWTGANGLHTYQSAINALSDNVANINSVGYKKLDTTFTDLLYSTQIGRAHV